MGYFSRDKCLDFIKENGDQEGVIILKIDQESATKHLCNQILGEWRDGRTVCEEAPVKSSGRCKR